MEILKLISENPNISEYIYSVIPAALMPMAIGAVSEGIQGLAQGVGSLFGGRARRREQAAAKADFQKRVGAYENYDFINPYANLENPLEDLRVNTQQAEFTAQQQQQSLANTLDSFRQSGGGLGAASLAQALAQQQSQNMMQASASIGQQESANQMAAAQAEMQLQQLAASGEGEKQQFNIGRMETLLDSASQRKMMADQARQQATSDLVGGFGKLAGGLGAFGAAGGFSGSGSEG